MESWLNFHHLRYFWEAARAGTITAAAARLSLTQPTVSAQIRELEAQLGVPLLERGSRGLVLTAAGRRAFAYADQIFGLGKALIDSFDPAAGARVELRIGVSDALSKLLVADLVRPLLTADPPVAVRCHEDKTERLIAELTLRAYDVVLTDEPVGPSARGAAENHALGASTLTLFAGRALAERLRPGFPGSLDGAPMLLPTPNTTMRRALDQWLLSAGLSPQVLGEFEDSALLKSVGASGVAAFPVATAVAAAVEQRYDVCVVGRLDDVHEPLYGITLRQARPSPAVRRLLELARELLDRAASR